MEAMEGGTYLEARLELGSKLNSVLYCFRNRTRETENTPTQVYVLSSAYASIQSLDESSPVLLFVFV